MALNLGGAISGAASGAAVGSAVPGIGTAVGAGAGALLGLISGPMSGGGSVPKTLISGASPSIGIDFSNWTVSTGQSTANGASTNTAAPPWLMFAGLGLAAIVAVRWIAKKH